MKTALIILLLCFILAACAYGKGKKEIIVDEKTTLIDVRTKAEYDSGHLESAINIPYTEIKQKIAGVVADKDRKIIVYCRSGRRSGLAEAALKELGYKNVTNAGGYSSLKVKKVEAKAENKE